jgi:hypothetical protein
MNTMKNATTNTETMAQKHTRMYREFPLAYFIAEVCADWKSGDMALNRMESVVTVDLQFLANVKGYKKFFGKQERIGRLGMGNGFNASMGKVTPNEITAYFVRCIDFIEANGWDGMTAQGIYDARNRGTAKA